MRDGKSLDYWVNEFSEWRNKFGYKVARLCRILDILTDFLYVHPWQSNLGYRPISTVWLATFPRLMAWAICITAFLVRKRYCQTMLVKLSIWLLPLPKNPLTISTYQEKVCEFHDIIRRGCQNHLKPYNRLSCKLDWLTVFCQLFFSSIVTLCMLSVTSVLCPCFSILSVTLKKLVKLYDVKQN